MLSTFFQRPLTVPLHSAIGAQMPAVRAVKQSSGKCTCIHSSWKLCCCFFSFVDEEGNDGDGSITSICIACENAKPETRNRYAKEWCHPMVPMETFQETKSKLQKSQSKLHHYSDVIMDMIASQITSLTIVYSTVYAGADQRKHQSFASLAFVRGIHRWPVNSPHKWPVTRKSFPFDDVIMMTTKPREARRCLP